MRFDPETGKTTVFREPSGRANGLIFDPTGRLIAAEGANTGGNRRVSITERDGTVRTLADRYQGKRFNSPNDVAVDRKGRVYVSDPRYVGSEPRELDFEAVFRIDPDGTVTRLETTALKPNGVVDQPRRQDPLCLGQRRQATGPARAGPGRRRRRLEPPGHPRLRRRPGHRRHDRHDRRPDRRDRRLRARRAASTSSRPRARSWRPSPPPRSPPTSSSAAPTARPSTSWPARASTASAPP